MLKLLEKFLDQNRNSQCQNWLESGKGAGSTDQTINYILGAPESGATAVGAGVGNFSSSINAFAGTFGTNLAVGALITVNLQGAFFNSGPSTSVGYAIPSWITGGSTAAQAEILLHELAHNVNANGFVPNDNGNAAAQSTNNTLVMQNCGNLIQEVAMFRP